MQGIDWIIVSLYFAGSAAIGIAGNWLWELRHRRGF